MRIKEMMENAQDKAKTGQSFTLLLLLPLFMGGWKKTGESSWDVSKSFWGVF
jgi:hypothetical protein